MLSLFVRFAVSCAFSSHRTHLKAACRNSKRSIRQQGVDDGRMMLRKLVVKDELRTT